ncbi:MAG TPA: hypothetical protein VKQ32_00085 [Polyangia bacterium]|nr:hypothetical protein [Polyangia bacterium]
MNQVRLFRILIVSQMALMALSIAASVRLQRTLPAPLLAYVQARTHTPLAGSQTVTVVGDLLLAPLLIVAWIALLRFWQIGPWLYLASLVVAFLVVLGAGPTVETAIETALDTAWSTIGGVILAMSFFSDLRGKFGTGRL